MAKKADDACKIVDILNMEEKSFFFPWRKKSFCVFCEEPTNQQRKPKNCAFFCKTAGVRENGERERLGF